MTNPNSHNHPTNPQPTNPPSPTQAAIAKVAETLNLRAIGPATLGGRIADIVVPASRPHTWYVAAGSGGVWKTTNAGITWDAIFADQPSYSIGCLAVDPKNPDVLWVGTGENVSGRHVGWGDGVYCSHNGGKTWQCMGLTKTEHIGRILIDPRDSNTVYVAASGPLWTAGGERGLYKTTDGGDTWQLVLEIDDQTGVTDIAFAPDDPNTIYAAAYQRHRKIWALIDGGPGSGIYKSSDSGVRWQRLTSGLPEGAMGKIGLATSGAAPNVVYATIEADDKEKGFYRSLDCGESWEKRNEYISGGTGPHYYQEIIASPHDADTVYQVDVFLHVTRDGGKTFHRAESGKNKHSDNHALWIDPTDGNHQLVGCDGGLYETFDEGEHWRFIPNLPLSQFYRVALDNAEPFYNILGGAQDLGTLYGPSRTLNTEGVRNQDWSVPLGADGYHVAFDPTDPNIGYLEYQVGNAYRIDFRNHELVDIRPQAAPDDEPDRWNWDTPIVVSPHNHKRLYMASQRVWRSDDQGDSWQMISADLTQGRFRYAMPLMGRVHSVDDLYDNGAMSLYATITTLSESPVVEGLLYVGTDDGLIQVSEDGSESWRIASALPGFPADSFINGVVAAEDDADTVFVVADAHKEGDFSPYVYESNDRGKSWRSISGDLPKGTIAWALAQDHMQPNLLFVASEFGLYFTPNRGENWFKLKGNVPTISFRDLKLQRRENDLVGASFGRGFYVLDDYTPLRTIADGAFENIATDSAQLFPVRDAWWYIPNEPMQSRGEPSQGDTAFKAENPPFGATFTYFLAEKLLSPKEERHKAEKALREQNEDVPFPGWQVLHHEADTPQPQLLLLVRDGDGEPVRWLQGSADAGIHRVSWDLRLAPPQPIKLGDQDFLQPWENPPHGPLVVPGDYTVTLYIHSSTGLSEVGEPQPFTVKVLPTIDATGDLVTTTEFQQRTASLLRQVGGANAELERAKERLNHLRAALTATPQADPALFAKVDELLSQVAILGRQLHGDDARVRLVEADAPSIYMRAQRLMHNHWQTRQPPTQTQRDSLTLAEEAFATFQQTLATFIAKELATFEATMDSLGAPWTPGRRLVR